MDVILRGHENSTGRGTIQVQSWTKRERTLRALKFGGFCWGLALVSVLIPLLHFVLVPSFLIAGPIVALVIMRRQGVVLGGSGDCPHCKKQMKIVRSLPRFPLTDLCDHCQQSVKIEPA